MLSLFRKRAVLHVHRQMSTYTPPNDMDVAVRMYGAWVAGCTLTFGCAPLRQPDVPLTPYIKKIAHGFLVGAFFGACTPVMICDGAVTDFKKVWADAWDKAKHYE